MPRRNPPLQNIVPLHPVQERETPVPRNPFRVLTNGLQLLRSPSLPALNPAVFPWHTIQGVRGTSISGFGQLEDQCLLSFHGQRAVIALLGHRK